MKKLFVISVALVALVCLMIGVSEAEGGKSAPKKRPGYTIYDHAVGDYHSFEWSCPKA